MRLRFFLGMWIALALVVGTTVLASEQLDQGGGGGDQVIDGPGGTTGADQADGEGRLALGSGQVRVSGTVTAVHLEGAVLDPRQVPTPLTVVSERGFGNGAELSGVTVGDAPASIVWDGGRPFVLSSGAGLELGPVAVDLDSEAGGLRLALAGAHTVLPGTYRLDTPVAVGSSGMATPRDSATFEAGDRSLLEAHGDAALVLQPGAAHRFTGPGLVRLEGLLELTDAAGTAPAPLFEMGDAAYELTFVAEGAGWTVQGLVDADGAVG